MVTKNGKYRQYVKKYYWTKKTNIIGQKRQILLDKKRQILLDKKDKYYWTKKTNIIGQKKTNIIGQMTGTDPDHKLDVCFSIDVIP